MYYIIFMMVIIYYLIKQKLFCSFKGRSSEMIAQLEKLISEEGDVSTRDERKLESDLRRMNNYVLFMRNLIENGNDDEMMNMYDNLVRYVNDISGRNPFWLDGDKQAMPTVSLQSGNSGKSLDDSVDHLVTTCLGKLDIPTHEGDQFELVLERDKVLLLIIFLLYYYLSGKGFGSQVFRPTALNL